MLSWANERGVTGPRAGRGIRLVALAAVLCLLPLLGFGTGRASAALTTAVNCALPGSSFQGGDGNQDTPTLAEQPFCTENLLPTTTDWQTLKGVINSPDPQAQDSMFAGGNKESVPGSWVLETQAGGVTPGKSNIVSGWSQADAQPASTFLDMAFEREASSGDTFLTFELNQVKGLWENPKKARIPCRTTGDVLIAYNVGGGEKVSVVVYRWVTDTSKSTVIEPDPTPHACALTGHFEPEEGTAVESPLSQGAMNASEITNYLTDTANETPAKFGAGKFGEAVLNLTGFFEHAKLGSCFAFGQMWMSSRSSESIESQLQDYVGPVAIQTNSCSISGRKFDDANGSGKDEASKPGLEGWTIQLLDSSGTKVLQTTTTGSGGSYSFTNVAPGTYVIREVGQTGWSCDYPGMGGSCQYSVTLNSENINSTGNDFGNKPATKVTTVASPTKGIVGTKFGDSATVSGPVTAPAPTGNVEFRLYSDEHCGTQVAGPIVEPLSKGVATIPDADKVTPAAGSFWWVATYEGDTGNAAGKSGCTDEPITVEFPNFEVIKEQRLKGEVGYSVSPPALKAEVGDTVEYKITVKNTGNTALQFEALKDAKCSNFSPALGVFELAVGAEKVYTCDHVLVEGDGPFYKNVATVTGGGKEKPSKEVEVEVEERHEFEIKKEQKIAGEAGFTAAKLSSQPGKKVEYLVTVKNTGNTSLKFSALKDAKCSGIAPAGETTLAAGKSETFSCEHPLAAGDENPYKNAASIEGGKETKTSNTVEVFIELPDFSIIKEQRLKGEVGYSVSPPALKAEVGDTVEYKITVKNTGNTALQFEALKDAKCSNFSPALGVFELAVGAEKVYTCDHVLVEGDGPFYKNVATVTGGGKEKPSKEVEVEVEERHEFEIKKEQKIAGEAGFTAAKLSSQPGKKVEYLVTVKNTGNTSLKFSALKDAKCSGIAPAGETTLAAGKSETFSCEHPLAAGDENPYKNAASIEGGKETKTSNTVEVFIELPDFSIIKEQRLKGEVGYSVSPPALKAEVGDTVEYKITVKNTGNTALQFEALKDAKCSNFSPALGVFELAVGAEKVYTCDHVLVEGDGPFYKNVATVTGGGKEKPSKEVEVEVEERHEFEIKKEQKIAGEAGFTAAKLSSQPGKKVEYLVTVKNTGNTSLKFSALKDAKCSGIAPAGETTLAAGESETFSCEHPLAAGDENPYKNAASIEGGKETKTSNTVEVFIELPDFSIIKEQRLKGEVGYSVSPPALKAEVGDTVEYKITVKNTGNTALQFEALKDAKCSNFSPALGVFELAVGAEKVYTCDHVLVEGDGPFYKNVATVTGGGKEKPSKEVEVEVEERHEFEIKKEQKIAGEAGFTAAKLSSQPGKKVEYLVTVKNTGNTSLKFSALKDAKCSGIAPAGETTLAAGESETFSCEHPLAAGDENPYKNTASIEGGKETKTSNTVEVFIELPDFSIIKEQRLKGEVGYSVSPPALKAEVGDTVEYKITVKNTGNTALQFEALKDAKCSNFSPALGVFELAVGAEKVYTCDHVLVEGDGPVYKNVATVTGGGKEKPSKEVEVEVEERHEFEINKEQRIAGEVGFTKSKLTSEVGKNIEYLITVKNTGNTALKFSALKDANCSGILPTGETTLAAGESDTFSCEHTLAEGDENPYKNTASISGGRVTKASNTVEVEKLSVTPPAVAPPAKQVVVATCSISESTITLHGAAGSKRKRFSVSVPSLGITEVTFYVDGHKLKTFTAAHAVNGKFVVTINPRKYHFGAHRVSIRTVMTDPACAKIALSGVFVRARPARVTPKFTG